MAGIRTNQSNEIHIVRVFEAPVKAVWDAWTDPEQVGKWWGPRGFTLTTHSKDMRAGGHWNYTMHGPDGTNWPNKTKYFEVEKYAKLVYDHGGNDEQAPLFRVTVLFSEKNRKTTMDMRMALPTAEAAAETKKMIKKAGGDSTWDRLAEYLEKHAAGREVFVINRAFDVSREVMFDIWTSPDHVAKWMPPTGFTMQYKRADIRPGGNAFYVMTGGSVTMCGTVKYLDIRRPDLMVYIQQFVDENEQPSRHPGMKTFPSAMRTTVQFSEEGPNRTRVTIMWEPEGDVTPEEVAAFTSIRAGMTMGWTGSLDKLEAHLTEGATA